MKVQRPGIGDTIALDMVLLRRLMSAVDANMPQLGRYQVSRAALLPGPTCTAGGACQVPRFPRCSQKCRVGLVQAASAVCADLGCRCAGACSSCHALLRRLATCWC